MSENFTESDIDENEDQYIHFPDPLKKVIGFYSIGSDPHKTVRDGSRKSREISARRASSESNDAFQTEP